MIPLSKLLLSKSHEVISSSLNLKPPKRNMIWNSPVGIYYPYLLTKKFKYGVLIPFVLFCGGLTYVKYSYWRTYWEHMGHKGGHFAVHVGEARDKMEQEHFSMAQYQELAKKQLLNEDKPVVPVEKKVVPALNPSQFQKFQLMKSTDINHNTKILRFIHDDPESPLGLPVASCILIKGPADPTGKQPLRPYTPITYDQLGHFDLMVKRYPKGVVSQYLSGLSPGDTIHVRGPVNTLKYEPNMRKKIGMVAGGTGITPMLQVIHEIVKNPEDKTEITLVFANIAAEDILLKDRIDAMTLKHKNLRVYYVLENPPEGWKQGVGYVSEGILKQTMPAPSKDSLILVCGPPPMMKMISGTKTQDYKQGEVDGILKTLGYNSDNVYKF